MSAEDQSRLVDEAERRSRELKQQQEQAAAIVAAILSASLAAVLPAVLRAYRRYVEALRPAQTDPAGQRYRPVAGTGQQAAKRLAAVTAAAAGFASEADLRQMERELERILRDTAARGIDAAQTMAAIQQVETTGRVPIPDDLIAARVGAVSGVIRAHATEFRSIISQVVADSAAQGFPGKRVERMLLEAFQGAESSDGQVLRRGLVQRIGFEVETEVGVQSLNTQLSQVLATGESYVRWVTAQDERVCPYCASRHGRIYIASRISIPAHPRCRCHVAVVPDEQVNINDMERRHDVLDAPFWTREVEETEWAFAQGKGWEDEDGQPDWRRARDYLIEYQRRPTAAERARYPGIEESVPPSYEPPY